MDYETVTSEHKLTQLNAAISSQEMQHYQLTLEKIANTGNVTAVDNLDRQLAIRAKAITALRAERELERSRQRISEQPPTVPPGEPDATTPAAPPAAPVTF